MDIKGNTLKEHIFFARFLRFARRFEPFIITYKEEDAFHFILFYLFNTFPFSIYCSQKLDYLLNIENILNGLTKNYTKKLGNPTIKSEQFDSPTASAFIKMESDFLSPESPPMPLQDIKSDLEPINIPTERRDSSQYRYDSPSNLRRFHSDRTDRDYRHSGSDYRNDDYKRSYDRHRRSRSRSRSNERKRYIDKKK